MYFCDLFLSLLLCKEKRVCFYLFILLFDVITSDYWIAFISISIFLGSFTFFFVLNIIYIILLSIIYLFYTMVGYLQYQV